MKHIYSLVSRFGTILFISGSKTGFVKVLLHSKSYFDPYEQKNVQTSLAIFYGNLC